MYTITVGNHPSQARDWRTNKPMFDNDGKPIPLFPKQRAVYLDGYCVAYISETRNIGFIVPRAKLGEAVCDDITAHVTDVCGGRIGSVTAPAMPEELDDDQDDEDEDDPFYEGEE